MDSYVGHHQCPCPRFLQPALPSTRDLLNAISSTRIVWNLVVEGPDHMYRATPFADIAGDTLVTN